jgi:hypothetical protein
VDEAERHPTRFIAANYAWAGTTLFILLAALKIVVVAHLDPVTILGLVAESSPGTILLGILTLLLPFLIVLVSLAVIAAKAHSRGADHIGASHQPSNARAQSSQWHGALLGSVEHK